jgi:hypothetical protein
MDTVPSHEIIRSLGKIEGLIEGFIKTQAEHTVRIDSQDARISKLERARAWLLGAGAASGAVSAKLAAFFGVIH